MKSASLELLSWQPVNVSTSSNIRLRFFNAFILLQICIYGFLLIFSELRGDADEQFEVDTGHGAREHRKVVLVEEIIERQMRRYKTRLVNAKQAAAEFSKTYIEDDYEDEPDVKIVRTKKFGVKPMNPEEACVQMELLQHNFYVFLNSETDEVNVVYKRKNNTYGLIEPELD